MHRTQGTRFSSATTPTMNRTNTPADLRITARDIAFRGDGIREGWWLGGDPIGTTFFNALSASFPQGERFFIDAVRRYRDRAEEPLRGQIASFIAQESMHTREHLVFNRQMSEAGYDLAPIDAFLKARFDWSRTRPELQQLGATIALEHFTAILAHALLTDPSQLDGAPLEVQQLWQWHAIEEIEHKAVAFDTFLAATREMSAVRRWLLRSSVMVVATVLFLHEILFSAGELFRQDDIAGMGTWFKFLHYVLIRPGMLRKVFGNYLTYYRPSFHPWCVDDRYLIARAERDFVSNYAVA
jgi:predicted metal-dependent hydrolase